MTDTRPDPATFWNKAFGDPEYRYGKKPNAFIAESLPTLLEQGARVLCVGDGEGRNGVWCARQGYRTTSLEPSTSGTQKIRALADEFGVDLEIIQDLMPSDQIADQSFDAVVLTYIHAPPGLREQIHRACTQALVPGGVIVLEGFTPAQRERGLTSGGPADVAMLFTESMLKEDFKDLKIEYLNELVTTLDEGPGHRGEAQVVRLIARR